MNYAELVTTIQNYAENSEASFVASIPIFVRQTEKRVYNSLYIPALRKIGAVVCPANNYMVTLPSDFLGMFIVRVPVDADHAFYPLLPKDAEYIYEVYPDYSYRGIPEVYAIYDSTTMHVAPRPSANTPLSIEYYHYPSSIVDAGTSWLGDNFDHVLLYGSLIEAAVYMKEEEDVVKMYTDQYRSAVNQMKRTGQGLDLRDVFRSGLPRVDPK